MKNTMYDPLGVPYYFAVSKNSNGGYTVYVDGNFFATAESRRDATAKIAVYAEENHLTRYR